MNSRIDEILNILELQSKALADSCRCLLICIEDALSIRIENEVPVDERTRTFPIEEVKDD